MSQLDEVDDPFMHPDAHMVFGAPGRAALVHSADGSVMLAVEDMDGSLALARLDPAAKARLMSALEAPPPA